MTAGSTDPILLNWRLAIERNIAAALESGVFGAEGSQLFEAGEYVLHGGGKRLRGLLTLAVAKDLGSEEADLALTPALALEILHAASLVHDDLPALDNDDFRRGKPSCHREFSEATAILTGDALIGLALLLVSHDQALSAEARVGLCRVLAKAWCDLCVGQQLDIDSKHDRSCVNQSAMIALKTGALFGACVESAAICAGVSESELDKFAAWGTRVGECFQALDDLDDGDRLPSERRQIELECAAVRAEADKLDIRLLRGATALVLELIMPKP
ncbi:MAG: polyprenyl synthetase family protein [Pseudomonadota bacterium]|jgi:geranylgeranyl pyrophosphate synthase